jgi:hypothetical protein
VCRKGTCLVSCSMEIPKSSSTSSRPLAIGNSGILSGFWGDIFKAAVPLKRSAGFLLEANAGFSGHTTWTTFLSRPRFGTSGSNATQQRLISRSGKFVRSGYLNPLAKIEIPRCWLDLKIGLYTKNILCMRVLHKIQRIVNNIVDNAECDRFLYENERGPSPEQ